MPKILLVSRRCGDGVLVAQAHADAELVGSGAEGPLPRLRRAPGRNRSGVQGARLNPLGLFLEPPGPLLTHIHTVYMAYSERLPTRLNPLAERTCFSQASTPSLRRTSLPSPASPPPRATTRRPAARTSPRRGSASRATRRPRRCAASRAATRSAPPSRTASTPRTTRPARSVLPHPVLVHTRDSYRDGK